MWIIHPVILAQPIWTGIYFGLGFMIATAVVGAAAFLIFGIVGWNPISFSRTPPWLRADP